MLVDSSAIIPQRVDNRFRGLSEAVWVERAGVRFWLEGWPCELEDTEFRVTRRVPRHRSEAGGELPVCRHGESAHAGFCILSESDERDFQRP